jgi:uncharacterized delta-60 repeat protein
MKSCKIIVFLLPLAAILILTTISRAQIDGVDNNYVPLITGPLGDPSLESLQPDGKLIVNGNFVVINGIPRFGMARLNTDGSVDPSFNCIPCGADGFLNSHVVQADGKILTAGGTPTPQRPKIVRLNPDGSRDLSFADVFTVTHGHFATVEAIQADGKAYVVTHKVGMTIVDRTLYRLNTDGTIDNSFTPFLVREGNRNEYFGDFKILPDGRMFIYGNTSYGPLAQINEDGSKNTAFESPTLTFPGTGPFPQQPYIISFEMQSDNKPVFTGVFETVNGISKSRVARLNPDGSLDTEYTPQPAFTVYGNKIVKIYPGDKTLYYRTDTPKRLVRSNPDGTEDKTFSIPDQITGVSHWLVLPDDKLLVYAAYSGGRKYFRLNADGSADPGFTSPVFELSGTVLKVAVAADDRAVIYGGSGFSKVDGFARPGFAQLNGDGTLDTKFDPGAGFTGGSVSCLAVQKDGKVLAGGTFTGYNGFSQGKLIRLNNDGSFDSKLGPAVNSTVLAIAVRQDSKILIGGAFNSIDSTPKTQIALLNSNGKLDSAFNTVIGGTSPEVRSLFIQGDGKIMVGGVFSSVNGVSRSNLARLNSDGTLDSTFNAGSVVSMNYVSQLSDGRYVVLANGVVKRLDSGGSVDNTFTTPATGPAITAIQPAADGSIIIGGDFTTVNGTAKRALARLRSDGSLDVLFNPNGTNARVWSLTAQTDGNVVVVGEFTRIGNVDRVNVARVLASAVTKVTPFDFDGDGRADISVTRPGDFNWYQLTGVNYNFGALQFGQVGDKVTPADFDGDGKTDIGVFRPATGDWRYRSTIDGLQHVIHWGQNGDTPLSGDYNGDGKADLAAVRNYGWWIANASNAQTIMFINFGQAGDKLLVGDFDGDGKADPAVYRPSEGNWYYAASGSGYATLAFHWGIAEDTPVPADYDGDGKTDAAIFRPSEGNWYVLSSLDGTWIGLHFGLTGDKPIAADYDGDGKADIAVYRPSDHYWYVLGTTAGFYGFPFGLDTDIPSPNAFVP